MSLFKACVVVIALSSTVFVYAEESKARQTPAEIMPITESNLQGHKSLYKEGWFIVSSSEKAFSYAKAHAITASGDAMSRAIQNTKTHSVAYGQDLREAGKGGVKLG